MIDQSKLITAADKAQQVIDIRSAEVNAEIDVNFSYHDRELSHLKRWIELAGTDAGAINYYNAQVTTYHTYAENLLALRDNTDWPFVDMEIPWPTQPAAATRYTAP